MTVTVRQRGSSNPSAAFPALERRELAVNTANLQIAVGAESGTIGQPLSLLAVRFFSATAAYVANDIVAYQGAIYKSLGTVPPGAWNASQWELMTASLSGVATKSYVDNADALKADITYVDAQNTAQNTAISAKLPLAGGTMTGQLVLNGDPTTPNDAATKNYVDTRNALKLNLTGGTLTGDLTISKATPQLILNKPASGQDALLWGANNGLSRWSMALGNSVPESSGNAGSNFAVMRYADNGSFIDYPFVIVRSNGQSNFTGDINITKATPTIQLMRTAGGQNAAIYAFTNNLARWGLILANGTTESGSNNGSDFLLARYDDAGNLINIPFTVYRSNGSIYANGNFAVGGATTLNNQLSVSGDIYVYRPSATNTGVVFLNSTGSVYMYNDGSDINLVAARNVVVPGLSIAKAGAGTVLYINGAAGGNANIVFQRDGIAMWTLYDRSADAVFMLMDADQSNGVYLTQDTGTWGGISDARMKSELKPVSVSERMRKAELTFGTFKWKKSGRADIGYTAQDFYRAFPEWVRKGDDEKRDLDGAADEGAWGITEAKAGLAALAYADELRERIEALEKATKQKKH